MATSEGVRGSDAILQLLRELLVAAGLDQIQVVSESEIATAPGQTAMTVAAWLENLTVSPMLVGVASYMNGQYADWIASMQTWQWLLFTARALWSFGPT